METCCVFVCVCFCFVFSFLCCFTLVHMTVREYLLHGILSTGETIEGKIHRLSLGEQLYPLTV